MNTRILSRLLLLFAAALLFEAAATAQEKKVAAAAPALVKEIQAMDSTLFAAYNRQDLRSFSSLFTEDLEWFQDNGGLLSRQTVFDAVESNFKKSSKLSRTLVKGSLEVHPIRDYGAIETGVHQFRHMEGGKEVVGTFKFLMIWQKKDGQWKVSRVVSYDH